LAAFLEVGGEGVAGGVGWVADSGVSAAVVSGVGAGAGAVVAAGGEAGSEVAPGSEVDAMPGAVTS
ncbi:hypothetical protein, partial [Streptomyces sp. NRRL F-525]|uniref:hypothetical protein n=1 Tax=Streptomyces sp. NRRL F-525 TaxID=1463861 RepID=UPI000526E8E9